MICEYIYIYIYVQRESRTYNYVYIYIYICTHILYTCIHIYIYMNISTCMNIYIYRAREGLPGARQEGLQLPHSPGPSCAAELYK